jgi:hypothetical protein
MIAALAMSLSSVSVIANALRLRGTAKSRSPGAIRRNRAEDARAASP